MVLREDDLYDRTACDQWLDTADLIPVPARLRRTHYVAPFLWVRDQPGSCRKIGLHSSLEVKSEVRIGGHVGQPTPRPGCAGNDDPPVDIVEPDLHASWIPGPPANGRYVDHDFPALEGARYLIVHVRDYYLLFSIAILRRGAAGISDDFNGDP